MRWLFMLMFALASAAHAGDAFDAMRARWQTKLVGTPDLDRRAPEVRDQLAARSAAAQDWRARMRPDADSPALWTDIGDFTNPKGLLQSAAVTANANRLRQMALAYATPGSPSQGDPRLAAAVSAGIDWFVRTLYRADRPAYGNWWDWQIGAPQYLLDALCLMDGQLPADLRRRALAAVRWYVPDPRYRTRRDGTLYLDLPETGANLLDKALVAILEGMLGKDAARIEGGRDAIGPALDLTTAGDGFYRDHSFIQHDYVPYTGSYGAVALADYARLVYLLSGSDWPLKDPRAGRIFLWAREAYAPWIVDGAMPDAVRGRRVSSREQDDHRVGRGMIAALAVIADAAPPAEAAQLRAMIKGWMARDKSFGANYLGGSDGVGQTNVPLYELGRLKAIAADPSIPAAPEAPGARLFPSMDRAILRGPGFAAVLSLASPRTSTFEFGNGENIKAWWSGMGVLDLYDADQSQYGPEYRATIDSARLPGITTDHSGGPRPVEWKKYPNTEAWSGGASDGKLAALGMAFTLREVTGSALHGRKSWFFFGDRILALGSGIGGGEGETETIVANRRVSDRASLLVDGAALSTGSRKGARWAWLRDAHSGSRIGYVFPGGADVQSLRAERGGSWREINDQQSAVKVSGLYQSLAIPHGAPEYAYLLLPVAGESATRAAAADPGLRIDSNDERAAAAEDLRSHAWFANLWRAGVASRNGRAYVESSGPAAVLVTQADGKLRLNVSDPTQREATLELRLLRPVAKVLAASPGVTVVRTTPQLVARIATAGAAGASFQLECLPEGSLE
ncbi:polysaccharide lyase 8 family protein [Massilia terrae]|uniref:Polysaccharide lyase 8 family protein n=1 Tax=Massilia terrae TaxID=1811224 RepID=A0ABT2CUU1_9BURK|nr:polysaccharide lyase 8 family protein [Massilia terrae]MCS0657746.1 polysaccharide lyase 8 family protein [Massilia terrae]